MANWEVNKTKRYGKPIEEHDAKIRGQAFRIEASEGSDKGVLYLWNDLRGYERIAFGSVADLKRQAEGMGKREARGVAAIERRANYSRPGQPERFDRYGYEKMDYDRLMRESWYLKDFAEGAMSDGRKDPELRQKITALQQEFARRGFTAAATVLNAFLRKSFSRPGVKDTMAVEDRFYFGKGRKERFA